MNLSKCCFYKCCRRTDQRCHPHPEYSSRTTCGYCRNNADQMVFQTEKMLKENGDKMPADVKSEAEAKLADLKTAVQSGSIDEIKAKQDELSHVFEKMYQAAAAAQQAAGAQPGPDAGANNQQKPNDDGVVDADFKEV